MNGEGTMPTMNRRRGLALLVPSLLFLLTGLVLSSASSAFAASSNPTVVELNLKGVVDPFMASYVKRGIAAANDGSRSSARRRSTSG